MAADSSKVATAKQVFIKGQKAYDEGHFEEALGLFRQAYKLTGLSDILYNIATVADRLRHDEEALSAYERYLEEVPEAKDKEHVEGRIRILESSIQREKKSTSCG
ncbi:MAG: tetratricopeptide repeat protein [Myxococcales bacterium]|nr:MAG: tetratricopeptide repeat protein [Myxococcales bacterium]